MSAIVPTTQAEIVERVVMAGDLGKLAPGERVAYYQATCQSLGLNPLTRPFDYITLNGKLTLYARREATDQLRKLHGVSVTISSRERIDSVYVVTARATDKDGRMDESTGAVTVANLQGDALANALMKAETKAKRRVTLSIVGLGWLDETEIETIRDARPVQVDTNTGEIVDAPTASPAGNGKRLADPGPGNRATDPIEPGQLKRLNQLGVQYYGAKDWDAKRHELVRAITKERFDSSKELTWEQAGYLISGLEQRIEQRTQEQQAAAVQQAEAELAAAAADNPLSSYAQGA